MSFLILWNVTALMSSTIYRIRQTDTAQLSAQMNELLIGTFDPVEVESGVNLSGRFFFADLGPSQGIKVFDRSGKPFTMSKDSSTCLRPYAYVPSADGRSNWLCRVMNTRWIFFYDYRSSFGE